MIGSNLFDTGLITTDETLKMQSRKAKIKTSGKLENFCTAKETTKIKKATYRMRENICKPYIH